jgi:hypothetical protein
VKVKPVVLFIGKEVCFPEILNLTIESFTQFCFSFASIAIPVKKILEVRVERNKTISKYRTVGWWPHQFC